MSFKNCPVEAGNKELELKLKIMDDSVFLLPVFKCVLCGSEEQTNYDKFGEVLMDPVIEKTESQEEIDEFKKTLDYHTHNDLEEVWSKVRKVFDSCKDNCKKQGILIALKIIEEKMTELELKIWGKELKSYKTEIR